MFLIEFGIQKSRFYKRLTVVKGTIDLNGNNVLPQSGKLTLLYLAHFIFRIKHKNIDTVYPQKSIGNSRTGIPTGRYQHIDLLLRLFCKKILQQSRHKSRTHIFEGKGWTVEKFECIDMVFELYDRTIKRQRVVDDSFQSLCINIFSKKCFSNSKCYLLKRQLFDMVIKLLW